MAVLLIGTLDTKGAEFGYVRDRLQALGVPTLLADVGVLNEPGIVPDIRRNEIYSLGGTSFEEVRRTADRGQAMTVAAKGAARLAEKLYREGRITGVLGLGGSAGSTIATAAMRALPLGVPKVMVSTLASGQVQHYVGTRDITMIYSVVDLAGVNRISRLILDNAVGAIVGMLRIHSETPPPTDERPVIVASMFGVTTPCVDEARRVIEAAGYEVLVFHATGSGGRTMEGLIRDGLVAGVLDLTTTELADELVGGVLSAGQDRLTAAAIAGVPQVISVGALDMVNFGPIDTVPERFRTRRLYQHNATVTLMRTTPEENDLLGKEIAQKACASRGPTSIMLPKKGVSAIDAEGKPFWWPEADAALFQSILDWVSSDVVVVELDQHINDPSFARACAEKLLTMVRRG